MSKKWTKNEDDYLYKNYPTLPIKDIKNYFKDRSWAAIVIRASKLGIKRQDTEQRIGNIEKLLEDSSISYYWIGFIMADGHINHDTNRLIISLSSKDKDHLIKFSNFIGSNLCERNGVVSISIQDQIKMPVLINKFNFKPRKTYNPPNLSWIENDDLFLAFFAGFVDGDGHIKNLASHHTATLVIKCHSSWLSVLEIFCDRLENILGITFFSKPKINNQGYASWTISNHQIIKKIKRKIESLNLPLMKRKWDNIDLKLIRRHEQARINEGNIKMLIDQGFKQRDIAKKLGISDSCVCQIRKRISL